MDVLYSDDDKINLAGNRYNPQFKPRMVAGVVVVFYVLVILELIRPEI